MLDEKKIPYRYREYTHEPLDEAELRQVLGLLGLHPAEVLRRADAAAKELGLDGSESEDVLIAHMARHPTLLQRPIGRLGQHAVIGRPIERLLELVGE
ncbi:MAG: arsenate reductase (glutaredoxin) [Thermoanaerobaculia bacterium]|nr:arsenate reductase (glutaredoxin) [Thermoanaerobaculia bacterium]